MKNYFFSTGICFWWISGCGHPLVPACGHKLPSVFLLRRCILFVEYFLKILLSSAGAFLSAYFSAARWSKKL